MSFEEQPLPESKNWPPGSYKLRTIFKLRDGKDYEKIFDDPIVLGEDEMADDLIKKAISAAANIGLHNWGMDTYIDRFPNGQPVKFILKNDFGGEFGFIKNFDSDGCPVNS